ncbi:ankyrin repeat domain-containing protein [Demequina maris]|uniref:ankyrin repeat domain-containing protein n=1 Tax=Demequina maris TaxID=1638982 RepID=UPI0007848E8D|nr:ankyrin repeat domain-containing protein [Demequina maris]
MTGDLLTELESHGAAMAGRLGPEGAAAARGRIAKVRRRRAAGVAAVLVPALVLGGWMLRGFSMASSVDPAGRTGINLDAPLEPQMIEAIENGDHEAMRRLVELGVDPLHPALAGDSFAEHAVARCDLEALKILDDAGVDRVAVWDFDVDLALEPAITDCGPDVAVHVVETSPVGLTGEYVMGLAASEGSADVVLALVRFGFGMSSGVEDDSKGAGGWSALLDAARARNARAVAVLLEEGADPMFTVEGATVLEHVERSSLPDEIVEMIRGAAERGQS